MGCAALGLLAANLQAQLVFKTKFSAIEGYTNGQLEGQLASRTTNFWYLSSGYNKGQFLLITNETSGEVYQWIVQTVTNTATDGKMMVASDGNLGIDTNPDDPKYGGTPDSLQYYGINFPAQRKGPLTVTWDWQFFSTNVLQHEIPADYDPTNNNYNAQLQGYDIGFTLADTGNRLNDGNTNAVFGELSTPNRLGSVADARFNFSYGACGGGGDWNNVGPEFKDGKLIHSKLTAYFGNPESPTDGSFDVWVQRDGEDIWHTTTCGGKTTCEEFMDGPFPFRRCPGEIDGDVKLDCITMWMNNGSDKFGAYVLVDNIRIVGPDAVPAPTLKIEKVNGGQNLKITFTGWLQAADKPEGPYKDMALPDKSPMTIAAPPADAPKYFRAEN